MSSKNISVTTGGSGGQGGSIVVAQTGSVVSITGGTFTAGNGGSGGNGGNGGVGGSALAAQSGASITITGGTFITGSRGSDGPSLGPGDGSSGSGGAAGGDLLANGGSITVYGQGFAPGLLTANGSGSFTGDIGGVTQTIAYDIGNGGSILLVATPAAAPEPSQWAALSLGALGLALRACKRRAAA